VRIPKDFKFNEFVSADSGGVTGVFFGCADSKGISESESDRRAGPLDWKREVTTHDSTEYLYCQYITLLYSFEKMRYSTASAFVENSGNTHVGLSTAMKTCRLNPTLSERAATGLKAMDERSEWPGQRIF
jgi:hypothetical protein